jgi:iron complex outermembrane recepter protein
MTRFSDVVPASRIASQARAVPATDANRDITSRNDFMSQLRKLPVAAAVSAALATAFAAAPALAQEQTAAADQGENQIQEVVVTGSRIATPNATSASPITVISTQSIQATGQNDVSNILNQLPQIFNNDLGQDLGNKTSGLTTAGGVATADLRGLGPNRTLVLVDGRRLGQGSPYTFIQSPAPDIDQVPLYMVDRIEVLTGGASSVYGSDAVAGVVNFVLKKNFEGIQIDTQVGENWHDNHNKGAQALDAQFPGLTPLTGSVHDGRNRDFSILAGTNFADGQGNITAWLRYYHQDPVASGDRDFGQCQLAGASSANAPIIGGGPAIDSVTCIGSSNSNFFRVVGTKPAYSVQGNSFIPNGSALTTPPAAFNSQPYIFMQREDDRYQAGFNAHLDLQPWLKPYAQFTFMDDRTHQEVAPAALFRASNPNDLASGNYYVNCGNPFLSAQQQGILGCTPAQIGAANQLDPANQINVEIGRRNIEGGGRISNYNHTNYRAVVGAQGDILPGWSYDAYAQFYYTSFFNSNEKYENFTAIDNALLVTGTRANPVCASQAPGCVPYNIFNDGGVTPDQLAYLYAIGTGQGSTTLRTYHADITGDLGQYGIKSPLANDGIATNFGWEHRNENVTFTPDGLEQSGQLSGFGSAAVPINNSQAVDEGFIEIRLPLVQDKAFAKELTISPGFRHSDYSVTGSVNTYKLDLTAWQPLPDFKIRGSFQRAIRAPSLIELYNPQLVGLIQLGDDPCAIQETGAPPTASLAQCLNTVSSAQATAFSNAYNAGTIPQATVGQLSQNTGGNPKLQAETATTFTGGIVFSPTAVPNLTGSIDWWQIRIEGEVGVLPANAILSGCLQTGNPLYCSQIVRQPNTFSLTGNAIATGGYINQVNVNIGAAEIAGIDLQTNYRLDLPASLGAVRFSLNGSYLLRSLTTPYIGAHTYDCAGLFGSTCQTVNPRWRHILTTTWSSPWNFDAGFNWRFIGKVGLDNNDPDPTLFEAVPQWQAYNTQAKQFPNMSYIDLFAEWHVLKQLDIRAGVNNVLDKDPPLASFEITAGGAANTYSTYDQLGRQLYIAFTAKF